jgi:hypothetical protein
MMTSMPEIEKLQQANFPFFEKLFGGRTPGCLFAVLIFQVLHIYDDLIDKDNTLTIDDIHKCFWIALLELPLDPFYRQHEAVLRPILMNSIVNWRVANDMENSAKELKHLGIAWIIRGSYIDLLSMALACERGVDYAVNIGQLLRDWAHAETFEVYLTNLAKEKAARNGKSECKPDERLSG